MGYEIFAASANEVFSVVQAGDADALLNVAVDDANGLEKAFYPMSGETQMIAIRPSFLEFPPNFSRFLVEEDC